MKTRELVEREGRSCFLIAGDIGDEEFCRQAMQQTLDTFGKLDILVNNAAEQHPQERLEDISREQLERTFRTNIFGMFFMTKAALPHLKEGEVYHLLSYGRPLNDQPPSIEQHQQHSSIPIFRPSPTPFASLCNIATCIIPQ